MRTFIPLLAACLLWSAHANAQQLSAAEYFIDADPGVGLGTAFPITTGNTVSTTVNVDASALPVGFHTLSVRLQDNTGVWGLAPGRLFYIYGAGGGGNTPASPIAAAEYFVDTDPGVGNGTAVTVPEGNTSASVFSVDVSALAVGFHTLSFRYQDTDGRWGLAPGRLFYIYGAGGGGNTPAAPIAAAEYFIGADPGVGNGTALPTGAPQNVIDIQPLIDASALPTGQYTLSVRLKDTQGRWGIAESRTFIVLPEGTLVNDECDGATPITLQPAGPCTNTPGSTEEATWSGDTDCYGGEYNDVWYTVSPGNSPTVTINVTALTAQDMRVVVYDACDGAPIFCASVFPFTLGDQLNWLPTYWLRVLGATADGSFGICATAALEDCLGVLGGPAMPGTACDDGNVNTIGDVYQGDCICAGWDCVGVLGGNSGPGSACDYFSTDDGVYDTNCQCIYPVDCEGTEGGTALPGTPCDDGNACTIGDTYGLDCSCAGAFWDTDADGICNADDNCPNLSGQQGDACDDFDPETENDVITALCVCAGTLLQDCEGVPGGPAQPGTSCDDGDPCTLFDAYLGDCSCAGTFYDSDGDGLCDGEDDCPYYPGQQGEPCDDANAQTIDDTITPDCICLGTPPDDCNGVPGGPAQPGTACDDGDDCTTNDIYQSDCICAGFFEDSDFDGVCDAEDLCPFLYGNPGDACDDSDVGTINDAVTLDCECIGTQVEDCNGVLGGPAQIGTGCDDGDPCTSGDSYQPDCACAGVYQDSDSDGICNASDNCPSTPGVQGDPCDDGIPGTAADQIGADCACRGLDVGCANGEILLTSGGGWANGSYPSILSCGSLYTYLRGVAVPLMWGNTLPTSTVTNSFLWDGSPDRRVYLTMTLDDDGSAMINGVTVYALSDCASYNVAPIDITDHLVDAGPNFISITATNCMQPCATFGVLIYSAGCGEDCNGEPGGPAQPGTTCDDANVCTINDVWDANCNCAGTFQDTDADGICNANDNCPNLSGQQGDACDDLNPNTTGDVITEACVCAGQLLDDCEGVPGGPAQPGTACDDANACTINDVWNANCNCAGTFEDTDGDGICNANDNCPNLFGQQGDACDDLNPNTTGDVITVACVCSAEPFEDCEGVPAGPAQPGTGCDDANACTINDVWDANCNCAGTLEDTDADGICNANDNCPNLSGQQGDTCDDLDANTENDMVDANCECHGDPLSNCTEDLVLVIDLDGNPGEVTWTVYDDTESTVVVSGGPYEADQANTTVSEAFCVPVGCYHLEVSDSGNDGGSSYVLSEDNGKRIIDASMGGYTSTSEIGGPFPARSFCVPTWNNSVLANWCDRSAHNRRSPLYCNGQPGATGYTWWFFDAHGTYNRRVTTTNPTIIPNNLYTYPIPNNVWLNVRVRPVMNGSNFGPACRIRLVPNSGQSGSRELLVDEAASVTMSLYPNPNRGGKVTVYMEGVNVADATMIDIDVYDVVGKRVLAERAVAAEGVVNHRMDLGSGIGVGLYMVNVTIEGQRYSQRLVIQ